MQDESRSHVITYYIIYRFQRKLFYDIEKMEMDSDSEEICKHMQHSQSMNFTIFINLFRLGACQFGFIFNFPPPTNNNTSFNFSLKDFGIIYRISNYTRVVRISYI